MPDARIAKTRAALSEAVLALAGEKNFNDLTIGEILFPGKRQHRFGQCGARFRDTGIRHFESPSGMALDRQAGV